MSRRCIKAAALNYDCPNIYCKLVAIYNSLIKQPVCLRFHRLACRKAVRGDGPEDVKTGYL